MVCRLVIAFFSAFFFLSSLAAFAQRTAPDASEQAEVTALLAARRAEAPQPVKRLLHVVYWMPSDHDPLPGCRSRGGRSVADCPAFCEWSGLEFFLRAEESVCILFPLGSRSGAAFQVPALWERAGRGGTNRGVGNSLELITAWKAMARTRPRRA